MMISSVLRTYICWSSVFLSSCVCKNKVFSLEVMHFSSHFVLVYIY